VPIADLEVLVDDVADRLKVSAMMQVDLRLVMQR
jgi:hypothetical protein